MTIEAEGVGNANGQLDAKKIFFKPDEFAIAVPIELGDLILIDNPA